MLSKTLLYGISSSLLIGLTTATTPSWNTTTPSFALEDLTLREVGARDTLDWRIYLERDGNPISFWHDIPLFPMPSNHRIVNFVVEIPRWTNGKIEIKRDEPLNPIFHDSRNSLPRYVENVWPHKSYPFLYGSIPQTWESPNFEHDFTGFEGDNDPVDLFDIGQDVGFVGQVKQVKILGGLALNDGDETDWKILGIDITDPLAKLVNTIEDVEIYRPGLTKSYRDWFTYYKVARGNGILPIVGETYQNASFIQSVLEQSHGYWKELVEGKVDANEINYYQTSVEGLESWVSTCRVTKALGLPKQSKIEVAVRNETLRPKYEEWVFLDAEWELIELPKGGNGTNARRV